MPQNILMKCLGIYQSSQKKLALFALTNFIKEYKNCADKITVKFESITQSILLLLLLGGASSCEFKWDSSLKDLDNFTTLIKSFDLSSGASQNLNLSTKLDANSSIRLGNSYAYNDFTIPGLALVRTPTIMTFDNANNILYFVSWDSGTKINILDTRGTASPSDDVVLGHYDSTTTPAIINNQVQDLFFDSNSGLLYISHLSQGLRVIDTQGDADISNDVVLHTYVNGSNPGITHAGNRVERAHVGSDGLLAITVYGGGLRLFDTKGTKSVADDTLVANYTNATTPSIGTVNVLDSHYSETMGVIFVGTNGQGVRILNTNGSPFIAGDDTSLGAYTKTTGIALTSNTIYGVHYQESTGFLYIRSDAWQSGSINSITVIDTKKTPFLSDDTLFVQYTHTELGVTGNGRFSDLSVVDDKTIYVNLNLQTYKISTNGTSTKTDDVITKLDLVDGLLEQTSYNFLFVPELTAFLISSSSGISVIVDNYQSLSGTYILHPQDSSSWSSSQIIKWESLTPAGTSASLKVRNANWTFSFDFQDGDVSNVSDLYNYGSIFPNISETNGILTLSGIPSDPTYAYYWIDSGEVPNTYPVNSYVEVKLRVTAAVANFKDCLIVDDWVGSFTCFDGTGDWQIVRLTSSASFSRVGFSPNWSGNWFSDDKIEIEYIRIITPDEWTGWSPLIKGDKNLGAHNRAFDIYQIGVDLTSSSMSSTPSVSEITIWK